MSESSPAPTATPATTSAATCAYISGSSESPVTCNGASTCTSDPLGNVVYCNTGTANLTIATKCVPYTSSLSTEANISETLYCSNRASPYCLTYSFVEYSSTKYSMLTCATTDDIATCSVFATPTETETSPTPESSGSSTPTGAIVGGVVGGVAGLALIGVSIFLLIRRRKKKTRSQQPLDDGPASDHRSSTATPAMSVTEATSAKPLYASNSTDRHWKMQEEGRDRQNSSVAEAQELPGRP